MNRTKPLISIVLPVFNAQNFLPTCLDSLLSQSYRDFEVIAIDDFSKDNSYTILKKYRARNKRLKIAQNIKHYGEALTLNRALRKAKGQFIAFMDAKDVSYKDRIKKEILFLQKNPKVVAVGTQCTFITEKNKRTGTTSFPSESNLIYNQPLHGISMQFETVMINKHLLPKDLLKFNSNAHPFVYSDIFIKLLQYGELANLPQPPLQYHRTILQNNNVSLSQQLPSLIKLWLQSFAEYDYRPSIRSLLSSFFKPSLSSQ